MTAHQPHWTLSTTIANRTVSNQGRRSPKNQFHQNSYQQEAGKINPSRARNLNRGVWEEWFPSGCPIQDTPGHWHSPGGEPMEKVSPTHPDILLPVFPHNLTRQLCTTPELLKMCLRFEVDNNEIVKG